jgi:peptidyl-prolyl cis-trans isomerase SurA
MSKKSKFFAALVVTVAVVRPMRAQEAPSAPPVTVATPAADASPAAPATAATKGVIVERVLVRVNGEIFTQSQLTQRQVTALRDLEKEKRDDPKLAATVEEITPDLLVSAVDELLLVQRGREMGVKFTDVQFKESLENIKKDNKLDDKGLTAALKQEGLTLDELRQQLEKTAMIRAVQQREIGPSMSITQEEQRQYYDKHKADFMTPMTVTLRELMVAVTSTTDKGQSLFSVSDDNSSKAKIESLRARAIAGEDFATLASQSSDSATKANGGLIGPINVEDLTPALQEAVASLQPGGVTLAFRGPRGYQIFKLESRSTPTQKTFETVRSDIERAIRDERLDPETEKMLARLRTQAVIEWKDDTFRQMYEKRVYAQVPPPK